MKLSKISVIISVVTLVLLVIGFAIYILMNKIKADSGSTVPVVSESDLKTVKTDGSIIESDTRAEVNIPILMYHHIRDYNDPADKVGTDLSVKPSNFKAQIDYLKDNGFATITLEELNSFPTRKLPEKPVIITFDDGYDNAYNEAYPLLKANGQIGVFYIISSYIGREGFLTAIQIKELSDNKMEIGSHTADHIDMTQLSADKLYYEVTESKNRLESIIGRKVRSFCYPSGKHNDTVDDAVKNAGYLNATTTYMAMSSTSENKMILSRLRINPSDNITSFANKVANNKTKK